MDWTQISIAFLLGGIGGTLIGFFKPLIDWNIDKRKDLREGRKKLLANCRKQLFGDKISDMSREYMTGELIQLLSYLEEEDESKKNIAKHCSEALLIERGNDIDEKLEKITNITVSFKYEVAHLIKKLEKKMETYLSQLLINLSCEILKISS